MIYFEDPFFLNWFISAGYTHLGLAILACGSTVLFFSQKFLKTLKPYKNESSDVRVLMSRVIFLSSFPLPPLPFWLSFRFLLFFFIVILSLFLLFFWESFIWRKSYQLNLHQQVQTVRVGIILAVIFGGPMCFVLLWPHLTMTQLDPGLANFLFFEFAGISIVRGLNMMTSAFSLTKKIRASIGEAKETPMA